MLCRQRERHQVLAWFSLVLLFGDKTTRVRAGIHVSDVLVNYVFPSVNYFDVKETKWPYFDQVLSGRVAVLPSLNLDQVFPLDYEYEYNETAPNATRPFDHYGNIIGDDDSQLEMWKDSPKFLVVDFGSASSSLFEAAMRNTSLAAEKMGVDFVVLVVGSNVTWQEKFCFWWSHRFPGSPTKELPPGGNATHQHFFMAVGPGEGAEIIEFVERDNFFFETYEPCGEFYFGIDNVDTILGRDFFVRLVLYIIMVLLVSRYIRDGNENNTNSPRPRDGNRAGYMQFTGEDLGMGEIQSVSAAQDCPVCLETMQPGETVRILPCRHVLHHDCITGWFEHGKYSCPLCKMDLQSHLEEQRSASMDIIRGSTVRWWWRIPVLVRPFRRRIRNAGAGDHLIVTSSPDASPTTNDDEGDLELTEEPRSIT